MAIEYSMSREPVWHSLHNTLRQDIRSCRSAAESVLGWSVGRAEVCCGSSEGVDDDKDHGGGDGGHDGEGVEIAQSAEVGDDGKVAG
jgi:hypothetical protein